MMHKSILIITSDYPPFLFGGGGVDGFLTVQKLREQGIRTDVLAATGHSLYDSTIGGSTTHIVRLPTEFGLILSTAHHLKMIKNNYDIIYVLNPVQLAAVKLSGLGHECKIIVLLNSATWYCTNPTMDTSTSCFGCTSFHQLRCLFRRKSTNPLGFLYKPINYLEHLVPSIFMRSANHYIAISETMKEFFIGLGLPSSRVTVIPSILDEGIRASASPIKRWEYKSEVYQLLYVGRLVDYKGVQTIIEALSLLRRGDTRLCIVGTGPHEGPLRELCKKLEISDKVSFTGQVNREELNYYYISSDIFIHPGLCNEAFGRSIIEAISFSLPVIVSNRGEPPRMVGENGLIFEAGNPYDLKEKIEVLLDNKDLRDELSTGSASLLSRFNSETVISNLVGLLDKVSE